MDDWLAAVHATIATAPVQALEKINDQLIIAEVQVDPERARASWGLRPEHQTRTPAEVRFTQHEQR
jgi:hypothetical protein